ncbi:MAG TPA: DegT/DnrJ/EryC1/StrS family aminotransferase [Actinophytocola sp.]|uniref:DegT/DnrJ/EryC1/StrS family aminotransferase n=1 Tax=Actinophytocola sp. TaxID=1872138 RepID=UPI002DBC57A0|nr:DegT/DnrJ/EryC1/StrS family aminotransferase [Actinophytocola sp.]HEU5474339.1 DegT/DnrJ/EryC1/StrS family aminotransferase [Actinophytocola sp.]
MQRDRVDELLRALPVERVRGAPLRAVVARLIAARPARLVVTSVHTRQSDGLCREQYVLRHEHRDSIKATLLRPPDPADRPAILVCQGRNARLDQVTGEQPPDYPDRNVAEQLARAGFVTLTLDYGLAGGLPAESLRGRNEAVVLAQALELGGRSLLGALVEDAVAGLDWLAGRQGVDRDHIGLFGHSLGAAVALHTALVHDRPLPVSAASHLGGYPTLFGRLLTLGEGAALPGILRHADLADLYGALAPAPLQLQYGLDDPNLDRSDAAAAGEVVGKHYADVEAADRVEVLALPMGHGSGIPQAAEFFTRAFAREEPGVSVPAARIVFDPVARVEIAERIDRALASGALTLGPFGRRFEELAAPWTGRPTAAVCSGSAALEIACRIVGVAGRTVLVPVNTFFATAASAVRAGATVDFVDMEPDGLGMDPDALAVALSTQDDVAAVVPVHIAGVVSPALRDLLDRCAADGIAVIEDAAHAVGSTLAGRPAGAFGRLAAFSLYPTKVITSAEGGMLACATAEDLDEARRYRDQGKLSFETNVHGSLGSNWRMSEPHAAIGIAHLERLEAMLDERRRLAAWYDEQLPSVPRIRPYPVPAGVRSNYYKYVALLDEEVSRPDLKRRLRERHRVALAGEVYDTLLSEQPYFADAFAGRVFGHAAWFARHHVCLPLFNGMTERQQRTVVAALREELS